MESLTKSTRSNLLRWAGSKRQSANRIMPYLDFDAPYIEPFCGSAAFYFIKTPAKAYLNDNNISLIHFYKTLQKHPKELWEIYNKMPISEQSYLEFREEYNKSDQGIRKSALFLYLNHYCFNGIYRTNQKGHFNTPFGAKKKIKKKLASFELEYFSEVMSDVEFYSQDFEQFLSHLNPKGTCIFMDPPYYTKDDRVFGEYGSKPFTIEDLERMLDVAQKLSRDNSVVVAYKNCTEFTHLFEQYIVSEVEVTRNIGGFAKRRKRDFELVAVLD